MIWPTDTSLKGNEGSHATQDARYLQNLWAQAGILVPAAFRQCPQLSCEGWMCRPRWTCAQCYVQCGHVGCLTVERYCTGEHLDLHEKMVSQVILTADNLQHTSIMTIAKEKVSASLLYIPLVRTSGAAHRGV